MNLPNRLTFLICIAFITLQSIDASIPQQADKSGVEVQQTKQGVQVINIAAPNSSGLSHNQLTQFNVDQAGMILNNAQQATATQLGGLIAGNPQLQNGPATVILNEVTSHHPSQLQGLIEVAGKNAQVIIANPNGISCDGCGFINSRHASLITGTPRIGSDSRLKHFHFGTGSIAIVGQGLQGQPVDQLDLISQAVAINAQLWAQQANIITRPNQTPDGHNKQRTKKSLFSVDVATVGGMYAQRIKLVGTELGVGVNHHSELTTKSAVQLDHHGHLTTNRLLMQTQHLNNKGIVSASHLTLHADEIVNGSQPDVINTEQHYSQTPTLLNSAQHPKKLKKKLSASLLYPDYPTVTLRHPSLRRIYDKQRMLSVHSVVPLKTSIRARCVQQRINQPIHHAQLPLNQGEIKADKLLVKTTTDLHNYGVMAAQDLELAIGRDFHTVGGTLLSKKSMKISAQRHLTLQGATLTAQGDVTLQAQGLLTVGAKLIQSSNKHIKFDTKLSRLQGHHITLHAHKDLILSGSQITTQQATRITSNANLFLNIQPQKSQWRYHNTTHHPFGLQAFSWKNLLLERSKQNEQHITAISYPIGNRIKSLSSDVTLQASQKISLQGASINAGNNIMLRAKNILLQDAQTRLRQAKFYRQQQRGLHLTLNSPMIDAHDSVKTLSKAIQYSKHPDQRSLALLQGGEGLLNGWQAANDLQAACLNPLDLIKFQLGIHQKSQQSHTYQRHTRPLTNRLQAGKHIDLVATDSHPTHIQNTGNIDIVGGYLTGEEVNVQAQRDLLLHALPYQNRAIKQHNNGDRQGGVHLALNPLLSGTGLFAGHKNKQGQEQLNESYNSNSQLVATKRLKLQSGHDLYLIGAQASGERVVVKSRNNLLLSTPTTYTHAVNQQQQKILNATIFPTLKGFRVKSHQHSNTQDIRPPPATALLAGKDGFSIHVARQTQLNGALIKSAAEACANQLSTDTLALYDLTHTQRWQFKPQTLALNFPTPLALLQGGINTLLTNGAHRLLAHKESQQTTSVTPAAISPAQINIQHLKQQQALALLNRTMPSPMASTPPSTQQLQNATDKAKLLESIVAKITPLAIKNLKKKCINQKSAPCNQ